ncbi:MAG: ribonucleotide reductase N-terminal alpha domain-containing protein [Rubrivivax sp.]
MTPSRRPSAFARHWLTVRNRACGAARMIRTVRPHSLDGSSWPARLPALPKCGREVLRARYAASGEHNRRAVISRVAKALAQAELPAMRDVWARRFAATMHAGFVPAGRILAAAGTHTPSTWVNCFVQPIGGPTGPPLPAALAQTIATLRAGGGVGCDFSACDEVVATLRAFDDACARALPEGPRPGAMMGVLRVDHPQIEAFIGAKDTGGLTHFNLSVAVDDTFMHRVQAGNPQARAVWKRLARSACDHGEPGVLFIDTIRRDDSLGWCETIQATNPCGEQPLPAYGSCCLGSFDLTRFVRRPLEADAAFDHAALARVVPDAVRMLDNVIDLTPWPLPEQQAEAQRTRRIGLGVTGLADALILLGLHYGSPAARHAAAAVVRTLRDAAFDASIAMARERGPCPAFDAPHHLRPPGYASRLPKALRDRIARHGLRHSHLLSIAPAGSISLAICGGVSTGIEPVVAWRLRQTIRDHAGGSQLHALSDPAWRLHRRRHGASAALPPAFVTAQALRPAGHLAMLGALTRLIDGSISKTIPLTPTTCAADVARLLSRAWRMGVKGLAVYRDNPVIPTVWRCRRLGP